MLAISYVFSTWWLLIASALLLLVPGGLLVVMDGRRLGVLVVASLVLTTLVGTLWPLSHGRDMLLSMQTGRRAPDYMDVTNRSIEIVNGDFGIWWTTVRYSSPGWQAFVGRVFPTLPHTFFLWDDNSRAAKRTLLPLMRGGDRLHPAWWCEYGDVAWDRRGSTIAGAKPPLSVAFYVRIWVLFFPLGVFPGIWLLRKWRDRKRRLAGRCVRCNYDLRGTPGKCSECGLVVKGKLGAGQQVAAG
jgi:hypothetical protein